jgi:hypothetical protein
LGCGQLSVGGEVRAGGVTWWYRFTYCTAAVCAAAHAADSASLAPKQKTNRHPALS